MAMPSISPHRSPHSRRTLANYSARQIGRVPQIVRQELKRPEHRDWRRSLSSIAEAAFHDAFAGMVAIEVLRNPNGHGLVDRFLRKMRAQLESYEKRRR
jgi:hypothetical protein